MDLDANSVRNLARWNLNADYPNWFTLLIPLFIALAIWDAVWKVVAMWKSARNNQLAWFICLAIFNTLGILPLLLPEGLNGLRLGFGAGAGKESDALSTRLGGLGALPVFGEAGAASNNRRLLSLHQRAAET